MTRSIGFCRAAVALLLALLSSLAAGSPVEAQAPGQAGSPPKLPVKFGWQLQADFVFQAARAAGAFQEANLSPEYVQFPSGREMLAALQSKSIDISHASGIVFNVALAQGLDVKAFFVYQDHARNEGLVARAGSGIQKVADLAGKRLAFTRGSAAHNSVSRALAAAGLTIDKVAVRDLTPDKAFAAFINGDVDAWWVWQPWRAKAEAEGGKLVVSDDQIGVSVPAVWYARADWLAQNPEAARRVALAGAATVDLLKRDKSIGVKAMAKAMAISEEMAGRIFDSDYLPTAKEQLDDKNYLSLTSPAGLAKVLTGIGNFLYEQKVVRQRPEPGKAVDPKPLRGAQEAKR